MSDGDQQKLTAPLEEIFTRSGCGELYDKAKDCINNTIDWNMCDKELKDLDKCMCKEQERKEKGEK